MTDDNNAPKVLEVVSSKPMSPQQAHVLMTNFLEKERSSILEESQHGDELMFRLDHVRNSLVPSSTTVLSLADEIAAASTTNDTATTTTSKSDDKKAKKAAKKAAKKERKEKRKREKEASKSSKRSKKSSTS